MSDYRHRHAKKKIKGRSGAIRVSESSTEPEDVDESRDLFQTAPKSLDEIGVMELLEQDSRPTFILDLHAPEKEVNGRMNIVWCNKSLRFFDELRAVVCAETFYPSIADPTTLQEAMINAKAEFRDWATSVPNFDSAVDGYRPRHTFRGMFWTSTTLRGRYRVISASQVPHQRKKREGVSRSSSSVKSGSSSTRSFISTTESMTEAALLEETELSKQLADSESKFKALTELSPVGMYYLNPEGDILYCNDTWYEITGHPRGLEGEKSFMNVLSEIDHPLMNKEWELLTKKKGRRIFELRLRNPWIDPITGQAKQKWILASCGQEFDENGKLKTIMGTITDISAQKHAEGDAVAKVKLVEEVALQTEKANQHAQNFQQMAELAPCGMFTFDHAGTITWANSQWYEMTGLSSDPSNRDPMSFEHSIQEQDRVAFRREWQRLTIGKQAVSIELRLEKPWVRREDNEQIPCDHWILFLAVPQLDKAGNLAKIFGCTTDISGFKFAEHAQMVSRVQAEEAKRHQEGFIDMTSHEMRNPLSAIMLCADGIANSVMAYQASEMHPNPILKPLLDDYLDAAQTIVLCAQHQKRIIDDVLTLSKLNSTMLHVTPVHVDVETRVRNTIKMFQSELKSHNIKITFVVEPCYRNANIGWVLCDPVRLQQIFINLLANAIKFTQEETRREITVNLGASVLLPPTGAAPDITWFPSKGSSSVKGLALGPDWGTGEQVYLYFAVKDTGRGLNDEEKTRLFHRFSQASPKTHVQYGGSGLGLFISRELTELQGGEIGVASKAGDGSTFAFYIKARRSTTAPSDPPTNGQTNTFEQNRPHSEVKSPIPDSIKYGPPSHPSCDYHILLVEDNLINQKVLSKQLRSTGCTVHVANHGGEALDFLSKTVLWKGNQTTESKFELSLILMDLEMPVMDGLACTRRIRELEREGRLECHVPVIAVTANTRMEQMDTALEAGMDDIVAKPFQIPELMQKMDQLMEMKR